MQSQRTHIALQPIRCSSFIDYVLKHHQVPSTLVICSTREAFLEELLTSIHSQGSSTSDHSDDSRPQHSLLTPKIQLIATSQSVRLAFVRTLSHLRAYLATYSTTPKPTPAIAKVTHVRHQKPMLAIWGLVNLHRSTIEHSAQGISRTLASAVEAASIGGQRLVVAEPLIGNDEDASSDSFAPDGINGTPWKEEVPLLSGSIRFGGEERGWAGKMVAIGSIVARWCKLIRTDLTN